MRFMRDSEQPRVYHFGKTSEELEKEDLLLRIESLEAEIKRNNPEFQVPEPPVGLQRRKATQAQ